jgi:hypothetical protein
MQKYDSFFFVHVESSCLPEKQQIVILDENTAYQSIINTIHARRTDMAGKCPGRSSHRGITGHKVIKGHSAATKVVAVTFVPLTVTDALDGVNV